MPPNTFNPQQNLMPSGIHSVCVCHHAHKHIYTPKNQSSSSSCTPMLLLCTDVAHQDHLCMVYTCGTQRPLDLSCMHMHSAVARDNDVCK